MNPDNLPTEQDIWDKGFQTALEMLEIPNKRFPTHRCKVCGAYWIEYPDSWSLFSITCGKCCDNVAMGDQIEALNPPPAMSTPPSGEQVPVGRHPWFNERGEIDSALAGAWTANLILMAGGTGRTAFQCAALLADDIQTNPSKFKRQ